MEGIKFGIVNLFIVGFVCSQRILPRIVSLSTPENTNIYNIYIYQSILNLYCIIYHITNLTSASSRVASHTLG